jgi:hypothetical protein
MPYTLFAFPGLDFITYELTRYTDWLNELMERGFVLYELAAIQNL